MEKREITITINEEKGNCNFVIESNGMQKFEMIGILEVAIMNIKDDLRNVKL
jgi:hypothetical protein